MDKKISFGDIIAAVQVFLWTVTGLLFSVWLIKLLIQAIF